MEVFRTVSEFRTWRRNILLQGLTIGLVPTMGALHTGHISLIEHARKENDIVVISLFVNPAQFAPNEDFDAYPRTWDTDKAIIEALNLKSVAVFMPTTSDMYPHGIPLDIKNQQGSFVEVLGFSEQLEGLTRPHFFRGVATVVTKLFNIVQPERAYFGQKDIQQTVVLRTLVRDLHIPIDLKVCPTVREHDGLALSSRNAYLLPTQRDDALTLWLSLQAGQEAYAKNADATPPVILEAARSALSESINRSHGRVSLDYLSFVHPETLHSLSETDPSKGGILVGAIFLQGGTRTVRLIDNVILM